ncbi:hypothetical protein JY493_00115 [Serratia marcescens]|nr:hypothetical protein [Serratia marcescens]
MVKYLRRIGFTLTILWLVFSAIIFSEGDGWISQGDLEMLVYLAITLSIFNAFSFFVFEIKKDSTNDGSGGNLLSLWLKRKRLEEEKRISDLEK